MDRSVANMTIEQLYRKRAFDRINQRESRARKKTRIAELEQENAQLKRRLADSEDLVSRLKSSGAALREAIRSARTSLDVLDITAPAEQTAVLTLPSSTPTTTAIAKDSSLSSSALPSLSLSFDSDQSSSAVQTALESSTSDPLALALKDANTGLTLGFPLTETAPLESMFHFWNEGLDGNTTNAFSLSFLDSFSPESLNHAWIPSSACLQADMRLSGHGEPCNAPQWERVPLHVGASCRLDTVLLGLVQASQSQSNDSNAISELSDHTFPSIGSLLNPEIESVQSPISNAIGRHGRITMEVPSLPIKLGMMYNMCVMLRWLISPTKRNYDALPDYLKPRESQLTVPHPIWVDVVVWPEARERIIRSMDWSEFPILRTLVNESVSINWPHPQSSVLTMASRTELRLSPVFEAHIRNAKNWTWGPEVAERFPFLDCVPTRVEA